MSANFTVKDELIDIIPNLSEEALRNIVNTRADEIFSILATDEDKLSFIQELSPQQLNEIVTTNFFKRLVLSLNCKQEKENPLVNTIVALLVSVEDYKNNRIQTMEKIKQGLKITHIVIQSGIWILLVATVASSFLLYPYFPGAFEAPALAFPLFLAATVGPLGFIVIVVGCPWLILEKELFDYLDSKMDQKIEAIHSGNFEFKIKDMDGSQSAQLLAKFSIFSSDKENKVIIPTSGSASLPSPCA